MPFPLSPEGLFGPECKFGKQRERRKTEKLPECWFIFLSLSFPKRVDFQSHCFQVCHSNFYVFRVSTQQVLTYFACSRDITVVFECCLTHLKNWVNFNNTNWKKRSWYGMLRIRTRARWMKGADETTELWRPAYKNNFSNKSFSTKHFGRQLEDEGCSVRCLWGSCFSTT